ncbi:hypothetical protein [Variovorax sp. HJSM1_2]|uniref:hypothetical protein n=1 Tax=Variovorax sp. HJSM1_2 TaxID=3366263 RepID=UPI003BC6DEF4
MTLPVEPPYVDLAPSPAPDREDKLTFPGRMQLMVNWWANFSAQINAALLANFTNATAAKEFADASGVALAGANFKGNWSALSGALSRPASVLHAGSYWLLMVDLPNVAASTPGVSGDWTPLDPPGKYFGAGTRIAFAQVAAPTGWTRDTSDNANNRMLRVVSSGAGGGVGGSHSPILNNVVPNHTHGFSTGTESSSHNHPASDLGHQHRYSNGNNQNSSPGSGAPGYPGSGGDYTETGYAVISVGGQSTSHTHSGTTDNGSSGTNWVPRYIDLIICTKN